MCSFRYALSALCGVTLQEIPKSSTQRTRRVTARRSRNQTRTDHITPGIVLESNKCAHLSNILTPSSTEDHREISLSLTVVHSSPTPLIPQCTLWLFSAYSVLSSEKRNTKNAKNHTASSPSICWVRVEGCVRP